MKKLIPLFLLLSACGSGSDSEEVVKPLPESEIVRYDVQSSWYALNQQYDGVHTYSGAMGTYTAKHLPIAVKCEIGEWMTFSNNRDGDLSIYVMNTETGDTKLVHTVRDTVDPHQNAAIQCGGGKLWLTVSARSNTKKGYTYSSEDGEFWRVESEQYWSYPQLHWVGDRLVTIYTEYTRNSSNVVDRSIYSSCNNEKIIDDGLGHYSVSHYDGKSLHIIYNDHDRVTGSNERRNLNYKRSDDGGCTWSNAEQWHTGDYVYLKDLNIVNGEPVALVTISDSYNPNHGTRHVAKVSASGTEIVKPTNHNYTTGALSSTGEVVFPDGVDNYAGGSYLDADYVNYIRRVHGSDKYVASEGISGAFKSDSWIIRIN